MDKPVPLFSFSIDTKHLAQLGNGSVSNELKKEFEENKITLSKNSVWIKGTYLFSWDRVPGQDKMKFLQFLNNDRDFDWVKYATITKSPDHKSISIIGNNSDEKIELTIENTTLRANNGKKRGLKIKVNGEQYIYEEMDTERTIIDGADIYVIKEESTKLNVYAPAKISFPTMLALAGLYSKWQYLFSWDSEKKEGSKLSYNNKSIGEDEVKEKLFENLESVQSDDFEICLLSEAKKNEKKYKLLINDEKKETDDEKEEDATLTIRAGRSLFEWEGEITGNKIPQGLKDKFKAMLNIVLTEDMIPEQEQGRWKVEHGNSNYYIQQKKLEEECKIYGDEIHKLKVKNEEESGKFKFKIYKRRGEMF
jgi:hypothetical protein